MIDMVFDLEGSAVPENYPHLLWEELARNLPWLKEEENSGVLPLRGSVSGNEFLLARRSKLILRIAAESGDRASALRGAALNVGGYALKVGQGKARELLPANTLYAWMVESAKDEMAFLEDMNGQLAVAGLSGNLICDKYREISDGKQTLKGYGLVLHDLKPQASLQIQRTGLGGARHLGCGIFVPFKTITGLESE